MKRFGSVVLLIFILNACNDIEDALFKDVKGVYKGVSKEYLSVTINISSQQRDKLEGSVKFEINQAEIPEGETIIKYLPTKESLFTGEIITRQIFLTTNEYTVKVDNKDVNLYLVFNLEASEDGKRLTGNMTFSGLSDLGEVPIDVTKQ